MLTDFVYFERIKSRLLVTDRGERRNGSMKSKLIQIASRLWKDESGQTTTEYALILGVVVMIAMRFKSRIVNTLNSRIDTIGQNMDEVLRDEGGN